MMDKKEVIKELQNMKAFNYTLAPIEVFDMAIEALQDKPTGKWQVRFPYKDTDKTRVCSNCNVTQTVNVYDGVVRFKFCPYCGADMKGE